MDEYEKIVVSHDVYKSAGQAFADAASIKKGHFVQVVLPVDTFEMLYAAWNEARPVGKIVFSPVDIGDL